MVDEGKADALITDEADNTGIFSLARLRKLQPKLTPSPRSALFDELCVFEPTLLLLPYRPASTR